MNTQLTGLHARLQSNAKRAESLVRRAGEGRLVLRPKPDSWSPAHLQPVAAGDVLQSFLKSQNQLLEVVSAASGLALDRIKVALPVDSRVRYNVWSSFQVTDAHQRRHLWQAERAAGLSD
jgi:hypothetical protein